MSPILKAKLIEEINLNKFKNSIERKVNFNEKYKNWNWN